MLLSRMMTMMMLALTWSPRTAETTLATSKIATSGLPNRRRNWITGEVRFRPVVSLGPYVSSRFLASAPVSPCSLLLSCSNSFFNGTVCVPAFSSPGGACVACEGSERCILCSHVVSRLIDPSENLFPKTPVCLFRGLIMIDQRRDFEDDRGKMPGRSQSSYPGYAVTLPPC